MVKDEIADEALVFDVNPSLRIFCDQKIVRSIYGRNQTIPQRKGIASKYTQR